MPGKCKIGGTSRTATHRARELVAEYGTSAPFVIARRHAVADWFAVEQAAHRMLGDRRLPRSELFDVSPREASRVIRAAAAAYSRPWIPSVWLRRLVMAPNSRRRYRRGTNWIPFLLGLAIVAGCVSFAKPAAPAWLPPSIARTVLLLEHLR
jgi:hypothetical protein